MLAGTLGMPFLHGPSQLGQSQALIYTLLPGTVTVLSLFSNIPTLKTIAGRSCKCRSWVAHSLPTQFLNLRKKKRICVFISLLFNDNQPPKTGCTACPRTGRAINLEKVKQTNAPGRIRSVREPYKFWLYHINLKYTLRSPTQLPTLRPRYTTGMSHFGARLSQTPRSAAAISSWPFQPGLSCLASIAPGMGRPLKTLAEALAGKQLYFMYADLLFFILQCTCI